MSVALDWFLLQEPDLLICDYCVVTQLCTITVNDMQNQSTMHTSMKWSENASDHM